MKNKEKKDPNPMWGGRFDFGSNNVAKKYTSSLDKDKRLFKQDIKSSLAHALALREANLINMKEYSQIMIIIQIQQFIYYMIYFN